MMSALEDLGFKVIDDFVESARTRGIDIKIGNKLMDDYLCKAVVDILEEYLNKSNRRADNE